MNPRKAITPVALGLAVVASGEAYVADAYAWMPLPAQVTLTAADQLPAVSACGSVAIYRDADEGKGPIYSAQYG